MKTLYLQCETGISGDMIVGALLDLGADKEVLLKCLSGLPEEGIEIRIGRKIRAGIDCCDFDVVLDAEHDNHDHDMDYLYGHVKEDGEHGDNGHLSGDGSAHLSEHHHSGENIHGGHGSGDGHHEHHHEHHRHEHRRLKDVEEIIDGLEMTAGARSLAKKTFRILGEAEAKAHATTPEEVHFHEVGALDSIADIVAASVCFDNLGIGEVIIPKICEGRGTVRTQHGILPIPVPAVLNIVRKHGLTLADTDRAGELVTPTGAAFAAAVMTAKTLPAEFEVKKCGYGSGKREYEIPSILRAMIIEADTKDDQSEEVIYKLETNVDDSSGEVLGYVMERLLEAGARDAYFSPIFMKKNRPAYLLSVIVTKDLVSAMEDIIFKETTTIGIRRVRMERTVLERRKEMRRTPYGEVEAKVCTHNGEEYVYPEYESAKELAKNTGVPLKEIIKDIH